MKLKIFKRQQYSRSMFKDEKKRKTVKNTKN